MSNVLSVPSDVDINVWRAIVGTTVKIPHVNTYVYYFPQGHLEQSSTSYSDNSINYNFTLMRPLIPCLVLSVNFLAKYSSDQPYVKILLQPLQLLKPRPRDNEHRHDDNNNNNNNVISFVKILTRSDTNNVGGFSIPRYCADMILPQLDYTANPSIQTLVMRDIHNNSWEFQHIYRGTSRCHMLTTGWTRFVIAKRLVAGDSVVFIKKTLTNELFIGIRRARRFYGRWDECRDRLEALEAIATAARERPFEVVYYPRVGMSDFVVKAEKVKDAINRRWTVGTRVRMSIETDDTSRLTWIQGFVAGVNVPTTGMWFGSPWRMLQVNLENPEIAKHVGRVSPWEVEHIKLTPQIDHDYHPSKRLRALQDSRMPQSTQGRAIPHRTLELTRSIARQSSTVNELLELRPVERSYPGILLPANHNSCQLNGGSSSFQLFGKTINVSRPNDDGTNNDGGCTDLSSCSSNSLT